MRFTAKTSSADFSDGINDDDDDVGVVNDGDGLAWVLAKDPTVCVAHTPRDGSSACRFSLHGNEAFKRKEPHDLFTERKRRGERKEERKKEKKESSFKK